MANSGQYGKTFPSIIASIGNQYSGARMGCGASVSHANRLLLLTLIRTQKRTPEREGCRPRAWHLQDSLSGGAKFITYTNEPVFKAFFRVVFLYLTILSMD
jgi:hypothetical protein